MATPPAPWPLDLSCRPDITPLVPRLPAGVLFSFGFVFNRGVVAISERMVVRRHHESAETSFISSWTFTSCSPRLVNLVAALWLRRMGDRCCPHLCDPLLRLLRRAF